MGKNRPNMHGPIDQIRMGKIDQIWAKQTKYWQNRPNMGKNIQNMGKNRQHRQNFKPQISQKTNKMRQKRIR